jgi:hypothetical protein
MQRNVKAGTRIESRASGAFGRKSTDDKELEVGVIQEPLPVYHKEPMEDERRLAGTAEEETRRQTYSLTPTTLSNTHQPVPEVT